MSSSSRARPRPRRRRRCRGRRRRPAPDWLACRRACGQRIPLVVLVALGDARHGHVEQRDLRLEDVAEETGNAQRHVDARAVEQRERQHLDAGDAVGARVPDGSGAEIGQSLGEIVAAGAQRGRRPQVEHDRARVLAFILQVAAHDLRGRAHADHCGGAGRNGARIDSREIAPARQHVEPPARRRPGGARRHAATVERRQQARRARCRRSRQSAPRPAVPALETRPEGSLALPARAPPALRQLVLCRTRADCRGWRGP